VPIKKKVTLIFCILAQTTSRLPKKSAWSFFLEDEREAFKTSDTGDTMNHINFMSKVVAKWAGIEDKSKYEAKVTEDAERYGKKKV
jgi:hypothetical protein